MLRNDAVLESDSVGVEVDIFTLREVVSLLVLYIDGRDDRVLTLWLTNSLAGEPLPSSPSALSFSMACMYCLWNML
ncbi:hypothetical protein G6F46_015818 [Rhizopus delemar]|nr:hypothetical protein G6F46_015818 [Rhizopus delemar]